MTAVITCFLLVTVEILRIYKMMSLGIALCVGLTLWCQHIAYKYWYLMLSSLLFVKGNIELEINFIKEDQSFSVKHQDDKIFKMKEGEHECSRKRKNRKRKLEEDESVCDSGKRIRKVHEEVEVKVENKKNEKDMKKGNVEERKILPANEEKNDDAKLLIEDIEIQGSGSGDKMKRKKRGVKASLVLGKRFTKEEDEIIKQAVLDYVDEYQLGEKGVDMIMNCSQHPSLKGCWEEIAEALPHRPLRNIYVRAHKILSTVNRGKWTKEEINYIQEMHDKHGADWKTMAKKLGRYPVHVCNMYWFTKLPNMKKGQWSQDEYQNLFDLVHADLEAKVSIGEKKSSKHGMLRDNISWAAISDKLGTRHHLRCCSKWYQRLSSPMVLDGTWADADDYRMLIALYKLDASCEEEVDWDTLVEHRTGDLCRKRWKQMVRDIGEHGNKSFVEQVEVLSHRYCPKMLRVREKLDSRPVIA